LKGGGLALNKTILNIDFSALMDLRVDYAFKLFFVMCDIRRLISLLNAIFANKGIPRVIVELTILNPILDKKDETDKLSIIDIRAKLSDGAIVCIEMHLYGLPDFMEKSVRNWARLFGEQLDAGQHFAEQRPVICIAFTNGAIKDKDGRPITKVHSLFHIMERDDRIVLSENMELHYINMKAFVEALTQNSPTGEAMGAMFTNWLALITQEDIEDKEIIKSIIEKEGELMSAVADLARLSDDKVSRRIYERRLDEMRSYNKVMSDLDYYRTQAEESSRMIERLQSIIEQYEQKGQR
jgi:predicted transposase/invertase (TIGR01784 family)